MSYDDTNRAAIWPNRKKEKPTDPDLKGEGNFDGQDFWVSGWKRGDNESKDAPVLRLSFRAKKSGTKSNGTTPPYPHSENSDLPY